MNRLVLLLAVPVFSACQSVGATYSALSTELAESRAARAASCSAIIDTACEARLALGESHSGEFTRGDIVYELTVDAAAKHVLRLDPAPNRRGASLSVTDASGNRISTGTFRAGHPDGIEVRFPAAGTYYATLNPSSCCGGADGKYTFGYYAEAEAEAMKHRPSPPTDCPDQTVPQCAFAVEVGSGDSGEFSRGAIHYAMILTQPEELSIEISDIPSRRTLTLAVIDADYVSVMERRFPAGEPGAMDLIIDDPGKYFVKLTPGSCCGGGSNEYAFSINR